MVTKHKKPHYRNGEIFQDLDYLLQNNKFGGERCSEHLNGVFAWEAIVSHTFLVQ